MFLYILIGVAFVLADREKHFRRASHISTFIPEFSSYLGFFSYNVSGSASEENSFLE